MRLDEDLERHLFRSRFEDSPMPQALVGPDGAIQLANQALAELLGRPAEDIAGRLPKELRHASDRGGADSTIAALLAGEMSAAQAERIYAGGDGEPIPVLIHMSVIWDDERRVTGLNGYFQDLRVLRASERRLEQQEQFYTALGHGGGEFAHVLDQDGTFIYVSPVVKRLFGYEVDALLGENAFTPVHPDDVAEVRAEFDRVVHDGGTRAHQFRVAAADGEWRWVQNTVTNFLHAPIGGIVGNLVDVTDQREAETRLRIEQLRNQAIVETTREGIWILAPDGRTEYANERMATILGRPLHELYEVSPVELLADNEALLLLTRMRELTDHDDEQYELDYQHPDGTSRRLLVAATPFAFGDGAFSGSLAMVHDVTDQRRMEAELRHAALHDPLTGLPNRALLTDRLDQALLRQQEVGGDVTLLFVDLDHFKFVNDSRGHEVGDEVLVTVAERLRSVTRPQETVARLGGDEFVVMCTCDEDLGSKELSARIMDVLSQPIELGNHRMSLTASLGIAASPPYDGADLLRYADTALFAAKAAGRAQVRTFDPSLAEESERAYTLAGDLRETLERGGLQMHYQPIIALGTGEVLGYEALARWTHPAHGPVPPMTFVPIAEQLGLARALDRWAIGRSIADLKAIQSRVTGAAGTYVAVNLSAQHLADPGLEEAIVAATAETGVSPDHVSLEITEGAVMRDVARTAEILNRLRGRGYRIAIDDFGTGHSSLAYLRNFPITALKIDRSFVADLTDDEDVCAIVTSIVQLADAIGVDTIAEGIESMEQARMLHHLGCTAGQGWLWSKAVPFEEVSGATRTYFVAHGTPKKRWGPPRPEQRLREEHGLHRLAQMQREGASLTTIAAAMNSEGFRTPAGQRWHRVSVARALRDIANLES